MLMASHGEKKVVDGDLTFNMSMTHTLKKIIITTTLSSTNPVIIVSLNISLWLQRYIRGITAVYILTKLYQLFIMFIKKICFSAELRIQIHKD